MWAALLKQLVECDTAFCSKLSRWDFGDGVLRPAIFVGRPPLEAYSTRVVIDQTPGGVGEYSTRGARGGVIECEVSLWGDRTINLAHLGILADDLWRILDRARVVPPVRYIVTQNIAAPPTAIRDTEDFPGYAIPVEITYLEA